MSKYESSHNQNNTNQREKTRDHTSPIHKTRSYTKRGGPSRDSLSERTVLSAIRDAISDVYPAGRIESISLRLVVKPDLSSELINLEIVNHGPGKPCVRCSGSGMEPSERK